MTDKKGLSDMKPTTSALTTSTTPQTPTTTRATDAAALIGDSLSAATARAYRSDLALYISWCSTSGVLPVPATPEIIVGYVLHMTNAKKAASSIARAVAAISCAHEFARVERNPCRNDLVKRALKGMRRRLGVAQDKKAPVTAERINTMLSRFPATLKGQRDKALLALGFAGAFRRSELVALSVEDIDFQSDGSALITIRRSKTDQTGAGQTIGIKDGVFIRPLSDLAIWLVASGITSGPIFRAVDRHGNIGSSAMNDRQVARLVKEAAAASDLDPAEFSGHSLRAGFITSAAQSGCDALRIAETSRHKNMDILRGYVRTQNLTKNYAGSSFM